LATEKSKLEKRPGPVKEAVRLRMGQFDRVRICPELT